MSRFSYHQPVAYSYAVIDPAKYRFASSPHFRPPTPPIFTPPKDPNAPEESPEEEKAGTENDAEAEGEEDKQPGEAGTLFSRVLQVLPLVTNVPDTGQSDDAPLAPSEGENGDGEGTKENAGPEVVDAVEEVPPAPPPAPEAPAAANGSEMEKKKKKKKSSTKKLKDKVEKGKSKKSKSLSTSVPPSEEAPAPVEDTSPLPPAPESPQDVVEEVAPSLPAAEAVPEAKEKEDSPPQENPEPTVTAESITPLPDAETVNEAVEDTPGPGMADHEPTVVEEALGPSFTADTQTTETMPPPSKPDPEPKAVEESLPIQTADSEAQADSEAPVESEAPADSEATATVETSPEVPSTPPVVEAVDECQEAPNPPEPIAEELPRAPPPAPVAPAKKEKAKKEKEKAYSKKPDTKKKDKASKKESIWKRSRKADVLPVAANKPIKQPPPPSTEVPQQETQVAEPGPTDTPAEDVRTLEPKLNDPPLEEPPPPSAPSPPSAETPEQENKAPEPEPIDTPPAHIQAVEPEPSDPSSEESKAAEVITTEESVQDNASNSLLTEPKPQSDLKPEPEPEPEPVHVETSVIEEIATAEPQTEAQAEDADPKGPAEETPQAAFKSDPPREAAILASPPIGDVDIDTMSKVDAPATSSPEAQFVKVNATGDHVSGGSPAEEPPIQNVKSFDPITSSDTAAGSEARESVDYQDTLTAEAQQASGHGEAQGQTSMPPTNSNAKEEATDIDQASKQEAEAENVVAVDEETSGLMGEADNGNASPADDPAQSEELRDIVEIRAFDGTSSIRVEPNPNQQAVTETTTVPALGQPENAETVQTEQLPEKAANPIKLSEPADVAMTLSEVSPNDAIESKVEDTEQAVRPEDLEPELLIQPVVVPVEIAEPNMDEGAEPAATTSVDKDAEEVAHAEADFEVENAEHALADAADTQIEMKHPIPEEGEDPLEDHPPSPMTYKRRSHAAGWERERRHKTSSRGSLDSSYSSRRRRESHGSGSTSKSKETEELLALAKVRKVSRKHESKDEGSTGTIQRPRSIRSSSTREGKRPEEKPKLRPRLLDLNNAKSDTGFLLRINKDRKEKERAIVRPGERQEELSKPSTHRRERHRRRESDADEDDQVKKERRRQRRESDEAYERANEELQRKRRELEKAREAAAKARERKRDREKLYHFEKQKESSGGSRGLRESFQKGMKMLFA